MLRHEVWGALSQRLLAGLSGIQALGSTRPNAEGRGWFCHRWNRSQENGPTGPRVVWLHDGSRVSPLPDAMLKEEGEQEQRRFWCDVRRILRGDDVSRCSKIVKRLRKGSLLFFPGKCVGIVDWYKESGIG